MAANEPIQTDTIDFDGILLIDDLCRLLQTSDDTIRKRLKDKTFPIPPLPGGIDNRLRWAGPVVRRWIDENGRLELDIPPTDAPRGRR
jgi:predicted DNA-binding transcriptional regulator AlpA